MRLTVQDLGVDGVNPAQVCFILHRFIPATGCAWAAASPDSQTVIIDSLWGVPDGLQYLSHDSFEYELRREAYTERVRYKPLFIQEQEDGTWVELRVSRPFTRRRSLKSGDIAEIAQVSYRIACAQRRPTSVMWFCGIPAEVGIGRNLPWFCMDREDRLARDALKAAPRRNRVTIRNLQNLSELTNMVRSQVTLVLAPEVDLIREDKRFLAKVIELAKDRSLAVEVAGSTLGHAFYQLEKAGVTVVPADEGQRSRVRGKRVFEKVVRDKIAEKIEGGGEEVRLARLPRSDRRRALVMKLFEEAQEVLAAVRPEDVQAELADLLEIVRGLAHTTGVEWHDVQRSADEKMASRGGFEGGTVLIRTAWPSRGEKARKHPEPVIPLEALGTIGITDLGIEVPYAALLAKAGGCSVELPSGCVVEISLTGRGLNLVIRSHPSEDEDHQLSLPI